MRRKRLRLAPYLVSVLAVTSVAAQPIPAATPEGILCASTYVAVGNVLDAAIAGSGDLVDLKVTVTDVMGARDSAPSYPVGRSLKRGDVVPLRLHLFASLVITALPRERPMPTEQQVRDTFVGKAFIFAVAMMDHNVRDHSTFPANVWPMAERTWAVDTMTRAPDGNCPRPL
jgi:hypothetical protein